MKALDSLQQLVKEIQNVPTPGQAAEKIVDFLAPAAIGLFGTDGTVDLWHSMPQMSPEIRQWIKSAAWAAWADAYEISPINAVNGIGQDVTAWILPLRYETQVYGMLWLDGAGRISQNNGERTARLHLCSIRCWRC
ncbi:MAG: hypothetical protein U0694_27165 [Anaerolineae bacterium]